MRNLQPAPDTAAAEWIQRGIRGFAESVLSLVPEGFTAYARVFHPFRSQVGHRVENVRWVALAEARGKTAHAGMQLNRLLGWDELNAGLAAESGRVPGCVARPLMDVLTLHTATPDRCWFAIWEGFGGLAEDIRRGPTFELPHRVYHLLTGPLAALPELEDGPNLVWPDDRAWCVAAEVDLDSTYVGGAHACVDDLTAANGLETLAIDPATGITWDSDRLNL